MGDTAPTKPLGLFQTGDFALHSGATSPWKIDCDALTDDDIDTLALLIAEHVGAYEHAIGIPKGGLRLARALNYVTRPSLPCAGPILLVDDVLTTGQSMRDAYDRVRQQHPQNAVRGYVIFSRAPASSWITPIFSFGWMEKEASRG